MISCVLIFVKELLKWIVIVVLVVVFEMIFIKVGLGKVWFNFYVEDFIDLNWFNVLWLKYIYMFLEEWIIYNGNIRCVFSIILRYVYIIYCIVY